jgi:hypothetical protein
MSVSLHVSFPFLETFSRIASFSITRISKGETIGAKRCNAQCIFVGASMGMGITAVKLTALGRPQLLVKAPFLSFLSPS